MKTTRALSLAAAGVVVLGALAAGALRRREAPSPTPQAPAPTSLMQGFFQDGDAARARLGAWDARLRPDGTVELGTRGRRMAFQARLPAAQGPLRLDAQKGTAELRRGELLERWLFREGGLEQQWELAGAPAGEGPLEVALEWRGAQLESVDGEGSVWRAQDARLRYGHATWVDARGQRTAIRGEVQGHVLAFRVPRELLQRSAYPAVLDPKLTPEQPVSTEPGGVAVVRNQTDPAVAQSANNVMVVWTDERRSGTLGVQESDIYGALVDVGTFPITIKQRFLIDGAPGLQGAPAVAAGANEFVVVWCTDTTFGSASTSDVRGAVIPFTGPTGRPVSFPIQVTAQPEAFPAIAYSGLEQKFLVVFDANSTVGPIQARRIDAKTSPPTVEALFQVSSSPGTALSNPRVAWSNGAASYAVVWTDNSAAGTIYYSRVAANANSASSSTHVAPGVATAKLYPDVVGGPSEHLILWTDYRAAPTNALYGAVVNNAGALVQTNGVLLKGPANASELEARGTYIPVGVPTAYGVIFFEFTPASSSFASGWFNISTLTPWQTTGYFQNFAASPSASRRGMAITANANTFKGLAVYSDFSDLYLVPITTIANLDVPNTKVMSGFPSQDEARVATLGSQVVVAWPQFNGPDGGQDFDFRRFSWDGGVLDSSSKVIASKPLAGAGLHVAAGVNEFMAIYSAIPPAGLRQDVFAAPISTSGTVGVATNLSNSSAGDFASGLAFDGTNYMAISHDIRLSGGAHFQIRGQYVAPSGAAVGVPFLIHSRGLNLGDQIRNTPSAGTDAGSVLVVVEYYAPAPGAIYRTSVAAGVASDTTGGLMVTDAGFPSLASGSNGDYLVVWEDWRAAATSPDIYGQRVTATGALVDTNPVAIEVGASRAERPSVTWNGRQYLVSWHERQTDGGVDLHGRWLSPTLQPLNEYRVSAPEDDFLPRAVSDGKGNSWVSFTRYADQDDPSVGRVYSTVVSTGYPGEACTTAAQCFAGNCVGGVCCDTPCNGACQTCLQTEGAPVNGTCGARTAGTICRPATDAGCDAVERCDGTAPTCPADGVEPTTTTCRAPAGDCDAPEKCDGVAFSCPADAYVDAGTVCQDSTLLCALSATCTGTSITCPVTGVRPPDTVCRARAGDCDVEEKCDGLSQTCPADGYADSTVVCRQAAGECDVAETCSGNSVTCTSDLFAAENAVCSAGSGLCRSGVCDTKQLSRYGWGCGGCGATDGGAMSALAALVGLVLVARRRRAVGGVLLLAVALAAPGALAASSKAKPKRGAAPAAPAPAAEPDPLPMPPPPAPAPAPVQTLSATPPPAAAAAAPSNGKLKLIFMGIFPGTGVSPETAQSVAEYVQSELTRIDSYAVVSQSDLQAMLGLERQKQLVGCGETSTCMAELSGALDADRLLRGEMSRLDDTIVLNFSLIDARQSKSVGRSSRNIETGGVSAALREVQPMMYELLNQAPEHQGAPLVMDRGFGGIVVGVRADADVMARGIAPAISAELSSRFIGGALTVLITPTPGVRLEVRGYPITFKTVRPYLSAGTTIFTTGLGVRGAAGAAVRFGRLMLTADAAYERYLASFRPGYSANAVVLGLGLGWQF